MKRNSETLNGLYGDGHSEEAYSDRADKSSDDGSQSNQSFKFYRKGIVVSYVFHIMFFNKDWSGEMIDQT